MRGADHRGGGGPGIRGLLGLRLHRDERSGRSERLTGGGCDGRLPPGRGRHRHRPREWAAGVAIALGMLSGLAAVGTLGLAEPGLEAALDGIWLGITTVVLIGAASGCCDSRGLPRWSGGGGPGGLAGGVTGIQTVCSVTNRCDGDARPGSSGEPGREAGARLSCGGFSNGYANSRDQLDPKVAAEGKSSTEKGPSALATWDLGRVFTS